MTTPTPNNQDDELEMKLMELFIASELFGQTFMTSASKEEFAEAIKDGALDHQEAAHEAMKLVREWHNQQLEQAVIEARLDEIEKYCTPTIRMRARQQNLDTPKTWEAAYWLGLTPMRADKRIYELKDQLSKSKDKSSK